MNARMDETQEILLNALDGDPFELNRLFERYRDRLVVWVVMNLYSKLRSFLEPEDIVQDTLCYAVAHFGEFRSRTKGAFWAWLRQIAVNKMRDESDHHGAKKRQPRMPVIPTQATPGTISMRREEVHRHLEAIQRLPDDYRDVLTLRLVEDVSADEIAERMERTRNAVTILICRARKALGDVVDGKD